MSSHGPERSIVTGRRTMYAGLLDRSKIPERTQEGGPLPLKHREVAAPDERAVTNATAGPRGIGTAVAFDWALGVQLAIDGVCFAAGVGPGSALASWQPLARIGVGVATCAAVIPCALAGEALRRGVRPFRRVQIAGNALLLLGGLASLPATISTLRAHGLAGHVGAILNESVLLFADAAILWLLTRPQTRDWFATTTPEAARARHGRRWMAGIVLIALAGGVAVAFDRLY